MAIFVDVRATDQSWMLLRALVPRGLVESRSLMVGLAAAWTRET